jgi:nucleoid-associated protein YgaU
MEIKPTGNKVEELYTKAKLHNFFGKSTVKMFAEELRAQLGPRLAEASPVKQDLLKTSSVQTESLKTEAAKAPPASAETETSGSVPAEAKMAEFAKAQAIHNGPVKAVPARTGAADGAPVKIEAPKGGPVDAAPVETVSQRILVVRNEPITIETARTEPVKDANAQGESLKIEAGNIALLKTELLRGSPARIEPAVSEALKTEPAITGPVEYIVKEGDSLWKIGRQFFKTDPYQIARDNGITNPNLIRPGQKLIINPPPPHAEPPRLAAEVTASWYGGNHHNKVMASGERFDMHKNTLAHKTLPLGTKVRLVNPDNGRFAEGVVTDRGPYISGRDVDVSYGMAKKLGFVKKGVTKLDIETI